MRDTKQSDNTNWTILFMAWLLAALATTGSLFFSEVMEFAPCVLCWYQRVFMYPLVITLALGLFPFDKSALKYSLPLAMTGWCFALYHVLLYEGLIPETLQPCRQGVSCTEVHLELLGFLSIPVLSLLTFTALIALLLTLRRRVSR